MALLPLMLYAEVYQQIKMYTFSALGTLINWYVNVFYVIKHIFMFLNSREIQLCWFCFRKFLGYCVDRSCISIRWCREMGMWPRHGMSSDCVWLRLLPDVDDSCKCSKWVAAYRTQWVTSSWVWVGLTSVYFENKQNFAKHYTKPQTWISFWNDRNNGNEYAVWSFHGNCLQ